MTLLTLDHIQLALRPGQEAAMRAFWIELLGCAEIEKPEALAGRGGFWVQGPLPIHFGLAADHPGSPKAHPAFVVVDLAALAARLEAASVPVRPDAPFDGRARFFATDPAGNRVEFLGG